MSSSTLERIATSTWGNAGSAFVLTYLIAGLPILHWWARSYFKGPNLPIYQVVFVVAFMALWILLSKVRDHGDTVGKLVAWGAGIGFLAGVFANGVADYTIMEPGTSISKWVATRVTPANLVVVNVALLSWVFGGVFAATSWLLRRYFGDEQVHA